MIIVLIVALGLLYVTPGWRRIHLRRPLPIGFVDQAVMLDMVRAALECGLSVPDALVAIHRALGDPAIQVGTKPRASRHSNGDSRGYVDLDHVAKMLLMGAQWSEAWENVQPYYRRLGELLAPAWNDGVAPAALLERGAQALRFSRARRAKEAAARLGTKLVIPLALCYLPAFMLLGVLPVVASAAGKLFQF